MEESESQAGGKRRGSEQKDDRHWAGKTLLPFMRKSVTFSTYTLHSGVNIYGCYYYFFTTISINFIVLVLPRFPPLVLVAELAVEQQEGLNLNETKHHCHWQMFNEITFVSLKYVVQHPHPDISYFKLKSEAFIATVSKSYNTFFSASSAWCFKTTRSNYSWVIFFKLFHLKVLPDDAFDRNIK